MHFRFRAHIRFSQDSFNTLNDRGKNEKMDGCEQSTFLLYIDDVLLTEKGSKGARTIVS